jgi:hypothetical protein
MYDIRETFDWNSSELYVASGASDATPFQTASMSQPVICDIAPVDLVSETLRNITLSLLQVCLTDLCLISLSSSLLPSLLFCFDSFPLNNKTNQSFLIGPLVMF